MAYNFIITADKLKERKMIHNNVPNDMVQNCIRTAQDLELLPLLGDGLYKYINDNYLNVTGNYKVLLDEYITDVLLYATMADLVLLGTYQMYTKGLTRKRDEFAENLDYTDTEKIADRYRYSLDNYKIRLVNYLKKNSSLFPQYENDTLVKATNGDYSCSIYLNQSKTCGC